MKVFSLLIPIAPTLEWSPLFIFQTAFLITADILQASNPTDTLQQLCFKQKAA